MEIIASHVTIGVSIGGNLNLELAIDKYNNLLVNNFKSGCAVNLGPLTQKRAREIGEYVQRLAIHTPEE
jgi:patatin-like phospholipase/acyl hydrolase